MRAVLVPFVFWLLVAGHTKAAFVLFVFAGVTDALDGFLAKRFNWQTELGAYLDPLADKLLIVSIFIALGSLQELPLWLVIAVVSRDIMIVIAVLVSWLTGHPVSMQPFWVSKANTFAQLTVAAVVLADVGFGLGLGMLRTVLVWTTGLLTVASFAVYMRAWLSHMSRYDSGGSAS